MADQVTILGIAGSLRKTSYNKGALRAAQKLCPEGARLEIYDIGGLPHYNQDEERNPTPKVTDFKLAPQGQRRLPPMAEGWGV